MREIFLLCLIIFPVFPQTALGCSGGFFDPYPRTILTAPGEPGSPELVRLVSASGRDWRIPAPAGLFDLESLTKATLPSDEEFKALAFSLRPDVVYFTDFSGLGDWPENTVPIVARVMFLPDKAQALDENSSQLTELTPEAGQSLTDFLNGETEHLPALISEEIYDRARPDLLLLQSPKGRGQHQTLSVTFNYNHGKSLDDSLVFDREFNTPGQRVFLSYSVPLPQKLFSPEAMARLIKDAETAFGQWLVRFYALNGIEAPRISWQ